MNESAAVTLLLQAALASAGQRVAFIQAFAHPLLRDLEEKTAELTLMQSFKPAINDLRSMGFATAELQGRYDLILLIPGKDKVQSLAWMASAFNHLGENGKLLVACENQYGAKSYETALHKLAGIIASNSKAKCRLFTANKTVHLDTDLQQQWLADGQCQRLASHGLWTQAGLFSWKSADVGSQLLLTQLPQLGGEGMDLCCGYGLLSVAILKASPAIKRLHMVDAEAMALVCAERNVAPFSGVEFHHLDAAAEKLPKHLDWIVCNPPFHTGQSRDVELGQTIVRRACDSLAYNGTLYLVANRQLPYERVLKEHLRELEILAVGNGFKVIRGKR